MTVIKISLHIMSLFLHTLMFELNLTPKHICLSLSVSLIRWRPVGRSAVPAVLRHYLTTTRTSMSATSASTSLSRCTVTCRCSTHSSGWTLSSLRLVSHMTRPNASSSFRRTKREHTGSTSYRRGILSNKSKRSEDYYIKHFILVCVCLTHQQPLLVSCAPLSTVLDKRWIRREDTLMGFRMNDFELTEW